MDAEAEAFLLSHDRPAREEWESPAEWDGAAYNNALGRVVQLKLALEEKLGLFISLDDGFQDASCFAALSFEQESGYQILRFSNFDGLAVAFKWAGDANRQIQTTDEQELLEELLREFGFIPVSPGALNQLYSGRARDWWHYNDKNFTWFNRFFDYL